MKQKWVLLAAILVGVLAFWLTSYYLRNERAKLYRGARKIEVVAADRDLPAGTVLKFEDVGKMSVFEKGVGANVVRTEHLDQVLNKRLAQSVSRKDPLFWSYLELPRRGRGGLAPTINSGMRAVSLPLGGDEAVSGLVEPNDRVDILGTFTFPSRTEPGQMEAVTLTVLQDVTVLATGQELGKDDALQGPVPRRRTGGYSTVTLEVTPREAELLVFAQHAKGQLKLTLRNPEDVHFEKDLPEINFQHLENALPELNEYRQRVIRHKTREL